MCLRADTRDAHAEPRRRRWRRPLRARRERVEGVIDVVPGCEGLRLDLGALWAEIDALDD